MHEVINHFVHCCREGGTHYTQTTATRKLSEWIVIGLEQKHTNTVSNNWYNCSMVGYQVE